VPGLWQHPNDSSDAGALLRLHQGGTVPVICIDWVCGMLQLLADARKDAVVLAMCGSKHDPVCSQGIVQQLR
jgi:hypothetical protein